MSFHSQQLLQHLVHCARICFSLHLLHGLADEEAEGFFLAAPVISDRLRIGGDDLLDDGAKQVVIVDHLQAMRFDVLLRINILTEDLLEDLLGDGLVDRACVEQLDQLCQMCGRESDLLRAPALPP